MLNTEQLHNLANKAFQKKFSSTYADFKAGPGNNRERYNRALDMMDTFRIAYIQGYHMCFENLDSFAAE